MSSPASRTTRGKEHPTARLSGPGAGQVWHRVQELAGRARKRLPRGSANRDARSPSRDSKNAIALTSSKTLPACQAPFTSSPSPGDDPGEVRRHAGQDTTGHRRRKGDPLYHIRLLLRASRDRLTPRQQERLRATFTADEAHISVEVAYHCAQHVRDILPPSHTHPRPTPGHTPHKAPTNVSHARNRSPGPDPTHMEGRTRRLLRHSRSQQRTPRKPSTESSNEATNRQRLPQPHQLPTPNAPHRRRPRCLHPHPTLKSRFVDGLRASGTRLSSHAPVAISPCSPLCTTWESSQ